MTMPCLVEPTKPKPLRRARGTTKPQLLTRAMLDGRTNAARYFDQLTAEIENDLGGHDQLSTIERTLVEAYVGACVTLQHLNTKLALGEDIDLSEHSTCVSAMVRVAIRLGLKRRARDVGLTLGQLRALDIERQRQEQTT